MATVPPVPTAPHPGGVVQVDMVPVLGAEVDSGEAPEEVLGVEAVASGVVEPQVVGNSNFFRAIELPLFHSTTMVMSTRLFFCLPSSVLLLLIGFVSPKPW